MKRTMVTAGLALAVSAGAAIAAPGKHESGKGWERVSRELRFDRDEARGGRGYEGSRSCHAVRIFKGAYDGRCKLGRALRQTPIWRGYPQSR